MGTPLFILQDFGGKTSMYTDLWKETAVMNALLRRTPLAVVAAFGVASSFVGQGHAQYARCTPTAPRGGERVSYLSKNGHDTRSANDDGSWADGHGQLVPRGWPRKQTARGTGACLCVSVSLCLRVSVSPCPSLTPLPPLLLINTGI